jgi:hypothetical protein
MIWMDITGCGHAEVPAKEGYYEMKSPGWTSTVKGRLLHTLGHTHDGKWLCSLCNLSAQSMHKFIKMF